MISATERGPTSLDTTFLRRPRLYRLISSVVDDGRRGRGRRDERGWCDDDNDDGDDGDGDGDGHGGGNYDDDDDRDYDDDRYPVFWRDLRVRFKAVWVFDFVSGNIVSHCISFSRSGRRAVDHWFCLARRHMGASSPAPVSGRANRLASLAPLEHPLIRWLFYRALSGLATFVFYSTLFS
ncbi:hypothetical protein SAMD00023353_12500090 [Rosellinia necatrix]|uniref:Uncharacterized protein n=1 Tax=Rosellinia necatrix TaxID=77044 RepID=A0A1S8ABT7_ROSNE|nr:hypothetical protein SAMD00023353_12500090 [Rosellinia necatrix]